MANLSQQVNGIMAQIDAIITMIERHNLSLDMFDNIDISLSPMEILLEILKRCGVSYDDIIEWLAQYIVEATPIIEIALKGILLAKLKSNVDCNLDPRIPQYLREEIGGCTSTPFLGFLNANTGDESGQERGIEIDLSTIDYYGMLNNSPMSDRSQYNYFGTKKFYTVEGIDDKKFYTYEDIVKACLEFGINPDLIRKTSEIDSIYELVRAKDMNAFLWFILHKARFLNVRDINSIAYGFMDDIQSGTATTVTGNTVIQEDVSVVGGQKCILSTLTGSTNTEGQDNALNVGDIFTQRMGSQECSVMSMCIKNIPQKSYDSDIKENATSHINTNGIDNSVISEELQNQKDKITQYDYTIVPTTNIWNGCNWYVNRSLYFDFWDKKEREYDKEFALFRLLMKDVGGVTTNKLVFTIKPGPNLIVPKISFDAKVETVEKKKKLSIDYTGDMPWNFFRLCFDVNGKQDFWGKYSIVVGDEANGINDDLYTIYQVKHPQTNNVMNGIHLYINKKTREYKLETNGFEDLRTALYECYPGFTVYEFNYDFIMGMRFFDPTIIVAKLIEGLTNIKLGLNVKKSTSEYQMRISEIVKNMLETNGYESTNCFFTFSNEQYNRMQEESELKRAQLYPFQDERYRARKVQNEDVYSVLNEFDSHATLEENISVVNRAITNASATITQESLPEDKYSFGFNFITQAVEMLTSIFVEALLSPKLLLVFLVNQKIMGEEGMKNMDLEKIIQAFLDIIMSMISELIDMILKKLLEYVMEKVRELLEAAAKLLALEQIEYYVRLLRQMLENCAFALPSNPNLASTLDVVDYADIDPNDKPITNEC